MEVLIVVWLLSGVVAAVIWSSKGGNGLAGFFLGLLLGIFGIIMVAVMTPASGTARQVAEAGELRECPFCKQQIFRDASVCHFCQRESEAWTYNDGAWWVQRDGKWLYLDEREGTWEPAPDTLTHGSSSGF